MQPSADSQLQRRRGGRHPGFTLVGTATTIATTLSLTLLGLPLYNLLNDRGPEYLLQEASLASQLEYARQEAVRLGAVVTVCPSRDGRSCQQDGDWRQGWLIFIDETSPSYHLSVGDRLLHKQPGDVGQQPQVAFNIVQYQADGSLRLK